MKKNDKNYSILLTLFVISIVIANVVGSRTITTGIHLGPITLSTSGGAITYAVTFLCTDIVGEIWGRKKAQSMVFFGFVGQIFATIAIILTGWCRAVDPVIDGAYQTLLGQNWVFVIGSLCAYYASQSWDGFENCRRHRFGAAHRGRQRQPPPGSRPAKVRGSRG